MTRSEVKELESIEVSSDAVPEGKQNPIEGISYEADEPMPVATQFETPRRPAPRLVKIYKKSEKLLNELD